jgi:hypothetical protein
MSTARALEACTLRDEAINAVMVAVINLAKHRKTHGVHFGEERLPAECELERAVCEAARKLVEADWAYGTELDAEVALGRHDGTDTVN